MYIFTFSRSSEIKRWGVTGILIPKSGSYKLSWSVLLLIRSPIEWMGISGIVKCCGKYQLFRRKIRKMRMVILTIGNRMKYRMYNTEWNHNAAFKSEWNSDIHLKVCIQGYVRGKKFCQINNSIFTFPGSLIFDMLLPSVIFQIKVVYEQIFFPFQYTMSIFIKSVSWCYFLCYHPQLQKIFPMGYLRGSVILQMTLALLIKIVYLCETAGLYHTLLLLLFPLQMWHYLFQVRYCCSCLNLN